MASGFLPCVPKLEKRLLKARRRGGVLEGEREAKRAMISRIDPLHRGLWPLYPNKI